jgi:flagellar basal body-associated protein FliL
MYYSLTQIRPHSHYRRPGPNPPKKGPEFRPPNLQGILAWLPALVILVGMPMLALMTAKYVVLPSFKQAYQQEAAMSRTQPVFFAKLSLSASNPQLAHKGFRSLALIGSDGAFQDRIDQNQTALGKIAAQDLQGKTAVDLYNPGELDAKRTQLLKDFNTYLGRGTVKEVYIAIWPPQ